MIEVCDIVCCVDVAGFCVVVETADGGVVEFVFASRVVSVVLQGLTYLVVVGSCEGVVIAVPL